MSWESEMMRDEQRVLAGLRETESIINGIKCPNHVEKEFIDEFNKIKQSVEKYARCVEEARNDSRNYTDDSTFNCHALDRFIMPAACRLGFRSDSKMTPDDIDEFYWCEMKHDYPKFKPIKWK